MWSPEVCIKLTALYIDYLQYLDFQIAVHSLKHCIFRANGHGADSVNTYAVISSAVNFAWAVGSMLGSSLTGTITQYIGFPWATTVIAAFDTLVVCTSNLGPLNCISGRAQLALS